MIAADDPVAAIVYVGRVIGEAIVIFPLVMVYGILKFPPEPVLVPVLLPFLMVDR